MLALQVGLSIRRCQLQEGCLQDVDACVAAVLQQWHGVLSICRQAVSAFSAHMNCGQSCLGSVQQPPAAVVSTVRAVAKNATGAANTAP
jgi:hypothetical protein